MPSSPLTDALLALQVQPGTHSVGWTADWVNETESGRLPPAAARFWSTHGLEHLLHPCCDDVLEALQDEWDEEERGAPLPDVDAPELDVSDIINGGECQCVYLGVRLSLPMGMFVDDRRLSEFRAFEKTDRDSSEGHSWEETDAPRIEPADRHSPGEPPVDSVYLSLAELVRWMETQDVLATVAAEQRLRWALATVPRLSVGSVSETLSIDLIAQVGLAHQRLRVPSCRDAELSIREPAGPFFYPGHAACTWHYSIGWKGAGGSSELEVKGTDDDDGAESIARGLSLGAVLQRSVGGDVGWNDGDLHGADFYLEPEGEEVQWEHLLHSIILLGPDQSCIGILYCGDSSDQADYVLE
jgi:hypothetical protein